MLRLLPIVLLANTVNSQNTQYQYRSDIEIGFDCEILNIKNNYDEQLNVIMEFRYIGTIYFNSAYDKNISINNQYGSVYYYLDSELLYQNGFSNAYGFAFSNFELTIDCDFQNNISVDFGAESFNVAFNSEYFADYIYDKVDVSIEVSSNNMSYYIDEGEGTIFTRFLGSQMGYQLSSYSNFNDGYNYGYEEGDKDGYKRGLEDGKKIGYGEGLQAGYEVDETAFTIFNGILTIGMIPINFFLSIFNFNILGIDMSAFVSALLSVCIVVIIFRFIFNGRSSEK